MADTPYGITLFAATQSTLLGQYVLNDLQAAGATNIRLQLPWSQIELTQGTYTWTWLDDAVSKVNAMAGMLCTFVIQGAPAWGITGNFPDPTASATFATQVATRYNGLTGHGHFDAIEIFNEEFDSLAPPNNDGSAYGPVVLKVQPAIKAAGFTGKIGSAALLGVTNTSHIQIWLQNVYNSGAVSLLDYLNFHYYKANGASPGFSDAVNGISFDQYWYTMRQVCINNNDPNRDIRCTEIGYPINTNGGHPSANVISEALQQQYLKYALTSAMQSGVVSHVYLYTMGTGSANNDGDSITQGVPPNELFLPSYGMWQQFITANPNWTNTAIANITPVFQSILSYGGTTPASQLTLPTMTTNDVFPIWQIQLQDLQGKPLNLADIQPLELSWRIQQVGQTYNNTNQGSFSIVAGQAQNGLVQYAWVTNDVGLVGTFTIQVRLIYPGGYIHFDAVTLTTKAAV